MNINNRLIGNASEQSLSSFRNNRHSLGGTAGTVADPKVIFVAALKGNANGIILAHNHPLENLNPGKPYIV